jgi:antitoxin MazE
MKEDKMRIHIQKWGNSLALRIPQPFAQEIHVKKGSFVDLSVRGGRLVLTPITRSKCSLKELLAGVTPQNIHGEIDTGRPRGKEIW